MAKQPNSILVKNRRFYDSLWAGAQLLEAPNFNTWPLIKHLLQAQQRRIEVAPGLRPRLPIEGTHFVDISHEALKAIRAKGGNTTNASILGLPFADNTFNLLCALDIIEHVEDDEAAVAQLARIAADGATLIVSTPLHQEWWTPFDDFVGHYRRYKPVELMNLLQRNGFSIRQSAVFGMKPKSTCLVKLGMHFLTHKPKHAMWWYNKIFPHIARRQQPIRLIDGLPDMDQIGEIFLVCKYQSNT